jgi:hypothetical protein
MCFFFCYLQQLLGSIQHPFFSSPFTDANKTAGSRISQVPIVIVLAILFVFRIIETAVSSIPLASVSAYQEPTIGPCCSNAT